MAENLNSPSLPTGTLGPKSPGMREVFFDNISVLRPGSFRKQKDNNDRLNRESLRIKKEDLGPEPPTPGIFDLDHLEEAEEIIEAQSLESVACQTLMQDIKVWINEVLNESGSRVQVRNVQHDLSDGLVLKTLSEIIFATTIVLPTGEFVQSEARRKRNVQAVVAQIDEAVSRRGWPIRWTHGAVYRQNTLATLHLLLTLIRIGGQSKCSRMPTCESLHIRFRRVVGSRTTRHEINLMSAYQAEKDAFDTLVEHAPGKLVEVEVALVQFANQHLEPLGRWVRHLERDFVDGVNFILLIGQLEGFFVPLYQYHYEAGDEAERRHNQTVVFDLLAELNLSPRDTPDDLVRGHLKPVLRILYALKRRADGAHPAPSRADRA